MNASDSQYDHKSQPMHYYNQKKNLLLKTKPGVLWYVVNKHPVINMTTTNLSTLVMTVKRSIHVDN